MKKFIPNPAQSYVAPEIEVAEIVSEGVLCSSLTGIPDFEYDEDGLGF